MVRPVKPSVALLVEEEPPDPDDIFVDFVSTFAIGVCCSVVLWLWVCF